MNSSLWVCFFPQKCACKIVILLYNMKGGHKWCLSSEIGLEVLWHKDCTESNLTGPEEVISSAAWQVLCDPAWIVNFSLSSWMSFTDSTLNSTFMLLVGNQSWRNLNLCLHCLKDCWIEFVLFLYIAVGSVEDLVPETIEQVAALAAVASVAVDQPAAAVEEVAAEDLEVRNAGQAALVNTKPDLQCLLYFQKLVLLCLNTRSAGACYANSQHPSWI